MYRFIMFDLDGTLTDSGRSVISCVEHALKHFGYTDQPMDKLRTFIGPSLHDSFIREYGMNEQDCEKAIALYRKEYESEKMYDVDIYEGVPQLLKDLKENGFVSYVITSKPLIFSEKILERIGLAQYFEHIVGPEIGDNSSDKKRLIEKAVAEFGLKKQECIMIGDTKFDILGACGAGIDSIGVTYGYGKEEELKESGATYIVPDTKAVAEILYKN